MITEQDISSAVAAAVSCDGVSAAAVDELQLEAQGGGDTNLRVRFIPDLMPSLLSPAYFTLHEDVCAAVSAVLPPGVDVSVVAVAEFDPWDTPRHCIRR